MKVVIFDIDGTLANCEHRVHHLLGETKNWDAFYAGLDKDPPHQAILELAHIIAASGIALVICTGRPGKYRERTRTWLRRHGIEPYAIYTRDDDDHRPDHTVKAEMLTAMTAIGMVPLCVVEDRASVVQMWRAAGLTCLQPAAGDF